LEETGEVEEPGINGGIIRSNEVFSGTVNSVDVLILMPILKRLNNMGEKPSLRSMLSPAFATAHMARTWRVHFSGSMRRIQPRNKGDSSQF
jgi:hypothetical protein